MWTFFPTVFLLLCTFHVMIEGTNKTNTYKIKSPSGVSEIEISNENISKDRRTPKQLERERVLRPVRIIPNRTPCSYKTFLDFYHDSQNANTSTYEVLMTTTITFKDGSEFYFYEPEELCIEVDDELVIDIYKYDCSQAEICVCGLYMGYVDQNVEQPHEVDGERRYVAVNGLDRKLVEEEGMCVSGHKGHCTLENSTALEKLDCNSMFECVQDDTFGPILENSRTKEIYGICLPKAYKVAKEDNVIIYDKINQAEISHVHSVKLVLACFIFSSGFLRCN